MFKKIRNIITDLVVGREKGRKRREIVALFRVRLGQKEWRSLRLQRLTKTRLKPTFQTMTQSYKRIKNRDGFYGQSADM